MKDIKPVTSYDYDLAAWAGEQAEILRRRDWEKLDIEHVIEELEDLGGQLRREVTSLLREIIEHLLAIDMLTLSSPEVDELSQVKQWADEIANLRLRVVEELNDQPGTKQYLEQMIAQTWPGSVDVVARKIAAIEGLSFNEQRNLRDRHRDFGKYTLAECMGFDIEIHRVSVDPTSYFEEVSIYPDRVRLKIKENNLRIEQKRSL